METTRLHEQISTLLLNLTHKNKQQCMQLIASLRADEMPRYLNIFVRKATQLTH